MKKLFFILLLMVSTYGFAQNNYIVKTEDGRRVLLKADFTWEYIDLEKPQQPVQQKAQPVAETKKPLKKLGANTCNTPNNFEEPKLNSKIQSQLKRGRASISHIKKKVAKDLNCLPDQVLLIQASEKKENGIYTFCANGTKVTYKRVGNSILQSKNSIIF